MSVLRTSTSELIALQARFVTVAGKQDRLAIEIEHVGTFIVPKATQQEADANESFNAKSNEDKLYNFLRMMLATTQEV